MSPKQGSSAASSPLAPAMSIPPPPGLDPVEEDRPPPGLDPVEEEMPTARYQVRITGLPNKLLTYDMMCCIFEEAGVPAFLGFTTRDGKQGGECIVGFAASADASHCVAHFEGCQWDASGAVVAASLEALHPEDDEPEDAFGAMDLDLAAFDEAHMDTILQFSQEWARAGDLAAAFFGCPWAASRMYEEEELLAAGEADTCAFYGSEEKGLAASSLSAAAIEFVPAAPAFVSTKALSSTMEASDTISDWSAKEPAIVAAPWLLGAAAAGGERKATSAASTEVGESEVDEDCDSPKRPILVPVA